ncbi:hypothetical protein [Adhaeribacter rhizoryzae]|uniref:Uncharacterized protein n=1 Tax=Adhaeribacter rhizoryzae TaxID=2607907 RepID=A0A5M6D2C2_9BACT|nr:hypothetical protein [Adhaeribacter rhizoryzae]KAA5539809.1 hypothetical protein F0145_23780 [Adhaeribacter rhizoryzae]
MNTALINKTKAVPPIPVILQNDCGEWIFVCYYFIVSKAQFLINIGINTSAPIPLKTGGKVLAPLIIYALIYLAIYFRGRTINIPKPEKKQSAFFLNAL